MTEHAGPLEALPAEVEKHYANRNKILAPVDGFAIQAEEVFEMPLGEA